MPMPDSVRNALRRTMERDMLVKQAHERLDQVEAGLCYHVHPIEMPEFKDYKFKTSCTDAVCLADIAADVNRDNTVVEVVIAGAKYYKFHMLLVHESLMKKMATIMANKDNVPADRLDGSQLDYIARMTNSTAKKKPNAGVAEYVTSSVCGIDVSKLGPDVNFREILKTIDAVRAFPLSEIGATSVQIAVRRR